MDGVGGEVKRGVWHSILQDIEVVTTVQEFYEAAQKVCKSISPLYISLAKVNEQCGMDEEQSLARMQFTLLPKQMMSQSV